MSDGASTTGGAAGAVVVVGHDERDGELPDAPIERWVELARAALVHEGVTGEAELTLVFVDEGEMAELNEEHMGVVGPTDVLAFPLDAEPAFASAAGGIDMPRLLGDVVISPTVAGRYATDKGWPLDDELALLVVHGVLHVLGHDHADVDDTALMQSREQAILDTLYRTPKVGS
jgi:probable rRNA maturation factor